jgi:hypothetical protein
VENSKSEYRNSKQIEMSKNRKVQNLEHFRISEIVSDFELALSEGWAHQDSNLGPRDYESPALTAEL